MQHKAIQFENEWRIQRGRRSGNTIRLLRAVFQSQTEAEGFAAMLNARAKVQQALDLMRDARAKLNLSEVPIDTALDIGCPAAELVDMVDDIAKLHGMSDNTGRHWLA
jgi:hypothetical protein